MIFNDIYGNDTYNVEGSNGLVIYNALGNDKYNLSTSGEMLPLDNVRIDDNTGKDTYTITGTDDANAGEVTIYDFDDKSADKYNVSYTTDFYSYDDGGKDTYNITQTSAIINDYGTANDTYNFDSLCLISGYGSWIDDCGGKDTLNIKNLDKNNIVYMTNYRKNGNHSDSDSSLILYDKVNKGFLELEYFYFDDDDDGVYDDFGDGRIETIKAGKTKLKDVPEAEYFTATLKNEVGQWLSNNSYSDVLAVLETGNDTSIQQLVAYFQGA